MERLILKTDNFESIVEINKDGKINGFKYISNNINPIDNEVIDYLKLLKCSDDKLLLKNKNGYDIFLDNNTNFLHFYKNGLEDIKLFFLINGKSTTCYKDNHDIRDDEYRKFEILKERTSSIILATLTTLTLIMGGLAYEVAFNNVPKPEALGYIVENSEPIELAEVKERIYASSKLTDEEKVLLYNEDFIVDVLKTKNDSAFYKFMLRERLTNMRIKSYGKESKNYHSTLGYYSFFNPNVLHIADYDKLNDSNVDTVIHEYTHLWQYDTGYVVLVEATAEILSEEYFASPIDAYKSEVLLTKTLMEIIGPEPIWNYVMLGDFSMIKERVEPYLTEEDYKLFVHSLNYNRSDIEDQKRTLLNLKKVLIKLFKNIYGTNIEDDKIIPLLKSDDNATLSRYYFNHRKITPEFSYYTYETGIEETEIYSYQEAYEKNMIHFYTRNAIITPDLTYAQSIMETNENETLLERIVDVDIHEKVVKNIHVFYADIDELHIENENKDKLMDELIRLNHGYYKVVEIKPTTYEEYINRTYVSNDGILIRYTGTSIDIDNQTITYTHTKTDIVKVNLPTINEKNNMFINGKEK